MAHIFDILSTVNGQLNILTKDYNGQGRAHHLNSSPDFVVMAVNRAIDNNPDILINPEKSATIERPTLGSTGDYYNPVYIVVVDNIATPIVDKVPVMVNYKDAHGPGTAIVLGVPKYLFDPDCSSSDAASFLRKIYTKLLDMDKEMSYSASPAILMLHDHKDVNIPTYDVTMMLVALGCININLRNWYVSENGKPVDPSHAVEAFPEIKSEELKQSLTRVLDKHCKNINEIRDAVGNGKLVRVFMYKE